MQKNNTKNIHLFPINNKFNRNILDCESIYNIKFIDNTIYKYFYKTIKEPENNIFIFNSSYLIPEVNDFIQSLSKQLKILIYIDNDIDISKIIFDNVTYITNDPLKQNLEIKIKILPKKIANKSIYKPDDISGKKDSSVIYFSQENSDSETIEKIKKYLYPSSNLKIKIFDNKDFKHPQNLGYTDEETKKKLLSASEFYLHDKTNYYTTEAALCGCILLDIDQETSLNDQIKNNKPAQKDSLKDIVYYIDFIREIIDE